VVAGSEWLAAGWLAATASSNGGFNEPTAGSSGGMFYFRFLSFFSFWFFSQ
jgi:hypothetical protein